MTKKLRIINLGKKLSCVKLQKLQNTAGCVTTRSSYDISSCFLHEIKRKALSSNYLKQKAILMFNTPNKRTPLYLQRIFSPSDCKLFVLRPLTDFLKRSFSNSRALSRNRLQESFKLATSHRAFRTALLRNPLS